MMTKTHTTVLFAGFLLIGTPMLALANEAQREKAAANFLEADANADGALTLAEFTTLIDLNATQGIGRSEMIQRTGRYEMAFGRIDANSDGKLSSDEMQAMAAKANR